MLILSVEPEIGIGVALVCELIDAPAEASVQRMILGRVAVHLHVHGDGAEIVIAEQAPELEASCAECALESEVVELCIGAHESVGGDHAQGRAEVTLEAHIVEASFGYTAVMHLTQAVEGLGELVGLVEKVGKKILHHSSPEGEILALGA